MRCYSISPESYAQCRYENGHDGAHEAKLKQHLSAAWSVGAFDGLEVEMRDRRVDRYIDDPVTWGEAVRAFGFAVLKDTT